MKIKIISLISALALILSLSACGAKQPLGTITPNGSPAPDISGSVSSSGDKTDGETEFSIGSTSGGTYENSFIGIGCSLDSDWTYYTQEELAELNGIAAESMTDEELAKKLETSSAVYDMYASADEGLLSINIIFENLGVLYGMTLDEESYIDMALGVLEESLTSSGCENVSCEKVSLDFCGETRFGTSVYAELNGVAIYEKQICLKSGNYMTVITLASISEDATDKMLELFYAL